MKRACSYIVVLVGLMFAVPAVGLADEGKTLILIRTLHAKKLIRNPGLQSVSRTIDQRVADLRSRLRQLPYREFQLMTSEQVHIPLKQRHLVRLGDGQSLKMRLLYKEANRVGIWLNWLDGQGTELLNTRMHVSPRQSFVAGTDQAGQKAMILAVGLVE